MTVFFSYYTMKIRNSPAKVAWNFSTPKQFLRTRDIYCQCEKKLLHGHIDGFLCPISLNDIY